MVTDIAIIGNGVAANSAAAYFRKNLPELAVAVVGGTGKRRPIVGEALVEASTHFIRELGLGPLLVERHHPKYGLTFYYKSALEVRPIGSIWSTNCPRCRRSRRF